MVDFLVKFLIPHQLLSLFLYGMSLPVLQAVEKLRQLMDKPKVLECSACKSWGLWAKCQACARAFYCSRNCQHNDWPQHKGACSAGSLVRAEA